MDIEVIQVQSSEDYTMIKKLLWEYFEIRGFDIALGDYAYEYDNIHIKYAPPIGEMVLAKCQGKAAGFVAYQKLQDEICEMKRMFVLPSFRRLGIGQKMAYSLFNIAKTNGYKLMRLDTHLTMHSAHKLYEKMGFYTIPRYNKNPLSEIRFYEKKLN